MDICRKKHLEEGIIQKKGAAFYGFILWKNIFFLRLFIHLPRKILLQIEGKKNEAILYFLLPLPTAHPLSFANKKDNAVAEKEGLYELDIC